MNYWESLRTRKLIEGDAYTFPSWGFSVYSKNDRSAGDYLSTNPFTRSLIDSPFLLKSIDERTGLARVNFLNRPSENDFYLSISTIQHRDLSERVMIYAFTAPFVLSWRFIRRFL